MSVLIEKPAILGGPRVRKTCFPLRYCFGEEEKQAAIDVLESGHLSGFLAAPGKYFDGGERVQAFERAWAEEYSFKHAISVNSWTSGLMAIVGAIGIEPGDEVICSPYTMSASATCALFYGGIPIFADIDPVTYCLDPASIEERITERTKAIIVVHIFGGVADMDSIMDIAERHGLIVVEDAAQAPGAYYKGKPVGTIGHIGGFSLNFHKHIHAGEGGLIVTNDDDLGLRCRLIRNHGENYVDAHPEMAIDNTIGGNYRLTEIQAAIALEQFKKLPEILERRNKLAAHLVNRLDPIEGIGAPEVREDCTHSWYLFPMRYDAEIIGLSRALFVRAVNAEFQEPSSQEQVALTQGYVCPLYRSRVYQERTAIGKSGFPFNVNDPIEYGYSEGLCPVVEDCYENTLILTGLVRDPLTVTDMDNLADAMHKVVEHANIIREAFADNLDICRMESTVETASRI